jgi:sulfite reductase (NADPH) flavoprotein alpha-component
MNSFLPILATFSQQQRAWLGGFVFGLTGVRPDLTPPIVLEISQAMTGPVDGADQEFPWHDFELPIVDRMELATGKPVEQKLMAAMAQLDCGSCGYLCETYSQAIAAGEEPNLTLCSPGGTETRRMIKQLLKESGGARANPKATAGAQSTDWSRQNPFPARLIQSRLLNKPGSAKETRHVAIDLSGSELKYNCGDALGVYPTNCPELAAMIVRQLSADPKQIVHSPLKAQVSFAQALLQDCCLKDPSDELLELLISRTPCGDAKESLQSMIDHGVPAGCDVLDVLRLTGKRSIAAGEMVDCLEPLNPRLYSIASSMKQVGDQVHLTVGKVTYDRDGRSRKGVASTMLADRIRPAERLRVFVQPNRGGFTVPQNASAPMVMIGPGTGIAPFIGFLQERSVTAATGNNWLFFGDQHVATDFLYEKSIQGFVDQGVLNRLDTAFSRDGDTKVYVQDRMRENAAELWRWLQDGAYVFVCGDASRMARDVNQTLVDIAADRGAMSTADAKAYIAQLTSDGRYVRDVY